jgi:hypothetical protein
MRWLVVAILLAGCADRTAERAALAGQFIGRSEAELVRDAGVPSRTVEAGGRRFVVYEERRVEYVPYGPFGRPYYWNAGPAQAVEYTCETNFEIGGGKVVGFSLRGNAC